MGGASRGVRLGCALAVLAALGSAPAPGFAGDGPMKADVARQHKAAGDKAFDEKRYADALAEYAASYALVPTPSLFYNQGRALQFMGRYPEALDMFRRFRAEAPAATKAKVPGLDALIEELEGKVGELLVECDTAGAIVMLGERKLGTLPFAAPIAVNAGSYELEVRADGMAPFHDKLTVEGRKLTRRPIKLSPLAKQGVLIVRSSVAGARVSIDGVALGKPPVEKLVEPGDHKVLVEADGYEHTETTVVVEANARKEATVDPRARPGLLSRWWFWTGVGVVVVGGATSYVLLTRERSPGSGSFGPGTITASLITF